MSEPTPTVAPMTPEELERWAVATILETVRWPQLREGLQARIKLEGTRALRGMPFTFRGGSFVAQDRKGSVDTVTVHGTIAGVLLYAARRDGAHVRILRLHINLSMGNRGGTVLEFVQIQDERADSGWDLTDNDPPNDQSPRGTLEIG
ncbi:MAG: hypothetical protein Q7S02_04420 [bacterium]|nr:hypothetical protein [bacterium]